ncbi:MAG: hypothetical protein WC044_06220 [Crocinitomicaceae bacterium]
MEESKHLENLQEIRSIMERSSRFLSLSGLSGIVAGITALVGATIAYFRIESYFQTEGGSYREMRDLESDLLIIAGIVLVAALGFAYFFTARKAKKAGEVVWNKAAKKLIVNLAVPLCTGGLVVLILLEDGKIGYIAPFTLVFYGLACINASNQTVRDIYYLGLTNVILGIFGLIFIGQGLLFWTLGFGFAHILYGTLMYFKYDRKS